MSDSPEQIESQIDYMGKVHDAFRGVVRDVLAETAESGLPGEHHFYVAFSTTHPGVGLSDSLRAQYPEEITIVLQHDYRDLEVDDDGFDVTLRFGGVPRRLRVPFDALTSFFDPAVHFLLRFEPEGEEETPGPRPVGAQDREAAGSGGDAESRADADASETAEAKETGEDGADVVSIDSFRRK